MADALLYQLAAELRDTVAAGLDAPPARQYVAIGPDFSFDCDQLVVHFDGLVPSRSTTGSGGMTRGLPRDNPFGTQPVGTFGVTLVRTCLPHPDVAAGRFLLPQPSAIDAVAEALLTDAYDAWRAACDAVKAGSLWATLVPDVKEAGVEVSALTPHRPGPQGDAVGVAFAVSLFLAAFPSP